MAAISLSRISGIFAQCMRTFWHCESELHEFGMLAGQPPVRVSNRWSALTAEICQTVKTIMRINRRKLVLAGAAA